MANKNHGLHRKHQVFTWIACAAELPDAYSTVLIFDPSLDDLDVWPGYWDGEDWHRIPPGEKRTEVAEGVTHWADLPNPPEADHVA